MGYNSTIVVLNDALHEIEKDPEFGSKVAKAIRALSVKEGPIDIRAGGHVNAASAVETHHADGINLIAVGGNCGTDLGYSGNYRAQPEDLLRELARKLGYQIVRNREKKAKG